jgi:hypothetical protein
MRIGAAVGAFVVLACLMPTWPAEVSVAAQSPAPAVAAHDRPFMTSHECLACHNALTSASGEDVSIGTAWRASMMANSSRDPYWQAAVRREMADHPAATDHIEDECSICHMPMATTLARAAGRTGEIFAHLPVGSDTTEQDRLAADGVSCTLCHQIGPNRLGTPASFTGGFEVNPAPAGERVMFGPFEVDAGRTALMRSATGVRPGEGGHLAQSEVCATCHTLFTKALDSSGRVVGELPEQVPYLEWRHSAFRSERSCQSCHMPIVAEEAPASSVLGQPRRIARHTFLGGNFFMLRMLNRYRAELGVEALPAELEAAAQATVRQLQSTTASIGVTNVVRDVGTLRFDVSVDNLTGHKFPTGYPSRRAWLHVVVRGEGVVFESGALGPDGSIQGNDHDADAAGFEPHYEEIRGASEVQVYEAVMADAGGRVTTGLLSGKVFVKDNRLLPSGFDKASAGPAIAVRGAAAADGDFQAGGDRVRYHVNLAGLHGPLTVDVELRFQPISFRWASNLRRYESAETRRFVSYYDSMAASSSVVIAQASAHVD